jgi:hypothetical protein
MTLPAVGTINNQYEIVNSILADAGINVRDLHSNQYSRMVEAVSQGNFSFGVSVGPDGRPVITGLPGEDGSTNQDDCSNARIPLLCRAQRRLDSALEVLPPLTPMGMAMAGTQTLAESYAIRIGIAALGVGLVIVGFSMLAGKQVINVTSGGSGDIKDSVSNIKSVAKKGVVLFATKNPAAAAAA